MMVRLMRQSTIALRETVSAEAESSVIQKLHKISIATWKQNLLLASE